MPATTSQPDPASLTRMEREIIAALGRLLQPPQRDENGELVAKVTPDFTQPDGFSAADLTFGVEIECHCPYGLSLDIGAHGRGRAVPQLPKFDGASWTVESDSSINTGGHGRRGTEFVSPVLRGVNGLRNLIDVIKILRAGLGQPTGVMVDGVEATGFGAEVNASCGTHVHVGWRTDSLAALKRVVHLVAGFERGIYASTGTKNRERGVWCKSVKTGFRHVNFRGRTVGELPRADIYGNPLADRYHCLNLSNLLSGRRRTVEFRFFSGSLNPVKIASYVQLCLGVVELGIKMPTPAKWDGQPAGAKFGQTAGEGERELNRLFCRLGWTSPKQRWFGEVGRLDGAGLPSVEESKRVLRRMARQYDQMP